MLSQTDNKKTICIGKLIMINRVNNGMVFKKGNKINVGRTPWNKNKKGLQKAWNKGTKGVMKSHRKGMTLEEEYGVERANEIRKKISERQKGKHNSPATEFKKGNKPTHGFKKGHNPWNKDKKTGIVPKTVFKKGECLGENSLAWKGGKTTYYRRIARKVVLDKTGIIIKNPICVHHINGDYTDNRPENLFVCTKSYHTWLHNKLRKTYGKEWREQFKK